MTDVETARRLERIEAKLDQLAAKAESLERAVGPVLANPGKLLAKILAGPRGNGGA